jgi:hypothetical protein
VAGGLLSLAGGLDFDQASNYTLELRVVDDGGLSSAFSIAVTVADANNKAPTASFAASNVTYVEDSGNVMLPAVAITDADTAFQTLASATLMLQDSNGMAVGAGEELALSSSAQTAAGNAGLLVTNGTTISIAGVASIQQYVAILSAVMYTSNIDEPIGEARQVKLQVNDGEQGSTMTSVVVNVQLVQDKLVNAATSPASVVFVEEAASSISVFTNVTFTQLDSGTWPLVGTSMLRTCCVV